MLMQANAGNSWYSKNSSSKAAGSCELHHACDDRDGLLDAERQWLVEALLPFFGVLQQLRDRHRREVGIGR